MENISGWKDEGMGNLICMLLDILRDIYYAFLLKSSRFDSW
jgi:hypothetical protein